MKLGVCWYPEQWPAERWAVDVRMMADAGLDLVRIGEFAWSTFEPERGRYDWAWLDRAVNLLGDAGLGIVLGTPTATPPVWLLRERPEILAVGPEGRRHAYGSRRHTCPTSRAYRDEAHRVVSALVDRYGANDAVVAWQIDNEPGNHDSARCWCDECQTAFGAWLAERYGDIRVLNESWGSAFWSQQYPWFTDVRLPVPTKTGHNPSLLLAHRRFASHQVCAGLAEQRAVIAAGSPGRDVTTNLYLGDLDVDARDVAAPNGLASFDSYPHGTSGPIEVAYVLDLARGTAGNGRAWVMEQQPGPVNWTGTNPMVPPGQVRTWALQAALHGMEALLFFRWRAARSGQERYHAGLLRHDGTPDLGMGELAALRQALATLDDDDLRPRATVALLHSYDDAWALDIDPHGAGVTHRSLQLPAYAAARRLGFDVDVVSPDSDLTPYRLVLAPALHIVTSSRVLRIVEALDAGASVVLGPRSLVTDVDDRWVDVPLPAGLSERLGTRVGEWGNNVTWPSGSAPLLVGGVPAGPWFETLEPGAGEVLMRYTGAHLTGAPAAVRNGGLVHAGFSSDEAWLALLRRIAGGEPSPPSVEVFGRRRRLELDHDAFTLREGPPHVELSVT